MAKLLLTSVLALSFITPGVSFAGVNVFGVRVAVEKQQVNSNVAAGSYIAKDNSLTSTLVSQRLSNSNSVISNDREDEETYYVFGVNIKAKNLI